MQNKTSRGDEHYTWLKLLHTKQKMIGSSTILSCTRHDREQKHTEMKADERDAYKDGNVGQGDIDGETIHVHVCIMGPTVGRG